MRGHLPLEALAAKYGVNRLLIEEWVERAIAAISAELNQPKRRRHRLSRDDHHQILDEISRDSEFKEVVVLFADMVDSSGRLKHGHAAEQDYERKKANQDLTISLITEAVVEFDGTVVQAEGDGVFALFGAPLAQEDYAVNACRAALLMLDLVRDQPTLAAENIQIRVGLYAGRVMAGSFSSIEKGAFGEAVNYGAHMEKYFSKPGEAWISESTYRLVQGFFEVEASEVADTKSSPGTGPGTITIYRLKRPIESATRFAVRSARQLSAFVGRDSELKRLRSVTHAVENGAHTRFAISGMAGVGKSRLVREFTQELIAKGWTCAELIGATNQQMTPYAPFIRRLRAWCGVLDADEPEMLRTALAAKLSAADLYDPSMLEALIFAFGLLSDSTNVKALDPRTVRNRAHDALLSAMRAMSGDKPALIVAEDIQWMDAESRAVIDRMARDDGFSRALIVMTCRTETEKDDKEIPGYLLEQEKIRLSGLPRDFELEMLHSLLGTDAGLNPLKAELRSRSKGNPLFVEEMVRILVDTEYLTGGPGEYRVTSNTMNYPRPSTVDLLFAARVDHLRKRDKSLLQAASVLGVTCAEVALAHLAEIPLMDLRSALLRLARAGLISSDRRPDGAWHNFNHAVCQQVVYEGLMPSRRVKLHRRALHDLESRFPNNKQEVIEALARHAVGAERWEDAVQYLNLACEVARRRWANREAVRLFDTGLEVLKKLKDGPNKLAASVEFKLKVLHALVPLGDLKRVRELLQEVEGAEEALSEEQRVSVYLQRSMFDWVDGCHHHGLLEAEKVLGFPRLTVPQRIGASFYRGMALHALGRFAEAIDTLEQVRAQLTGPLQGKRLGFPGDPVLFCDTFLGSALVFSGQMAKARQVLDAAADHARKINHPYSIALINDVLAEYHLATNHPEAAEPLLLQTLELCRDHDLFTMYPSAVARLALAETRCGRWPRGEERLREWVAQRLDTVGASYAYGYMLAADAETKAAAGKFEEALAVVKCAEARHRATGRQPAMAETLFFKAGVLVKLGRLRAARAAVEQSRLIAQECGMRSLLERCDQLLKEITTIPANDIPRQPDQNVVV